MLAIRMQRTGRSGHSQFRVIVQDSRAHPKSGQIVAYLGSYDPHTKKPVLDIDKINAYIKNGAQPSERMAKLLKAEGVKLPKWVILPAKKKSSTKAPEKLRRNRPANTPAPDANFQEEKPATVADTSANTLKNESPVTDTINKKDSQPETQTEEAQAEKSAESSTEPVATDGVDTNEVEKAEKTEEDQITS